MARYLDYNLITLIRLFWCAFYYMSCWIIYAVRYQSKLIVNTKMQTLIKFINIKCYYFLLLPFLTKKAFLDKVGSYGRGFMKKLEKYVDNTNEKNIHDKFLHKRPRRLDLKQYEFSKKSILSNVPSFRLMKMHKKPPYLNYYLAKLIRMTQALSH